jgi:predicted alpha/beta-hydrolase family hydrolase
MSRRAPTGGSGDASENEQEGQTTTVIDIATPHGLACAHVSRAEGERAALVLGHGAGGGITARDLATASEAALARGVSVALVEQPYRVAGRRSPAPRGHLDAAWTAVIEELKDDELQGLSLIVGGRSLGARVACRTAQAVGAVAVLCLAFPLLPPRRAGGKPAESRLQELDDVTVPVLVVQGERDPFGMPPAGPLRTVRRVSGDHSLRTDLDAVREAVDEWLGSLVDELATTRQ